MKVFPDNINFKYPWRSYQARILSALDEHLQNRHLHLIAPPGSGKTVLGLEVMRRLNRPTLILAPTLAIKNQWCERFVSLFLKRAEAPDWISLDLKSPRFLTITTYQSLHSLFSKAASDEEEGIDDGEGLYDDAIELERAKDIQKALEDIGFQTLILDEAHHLRTAWWKSTLAFRKSLKEPNVVALTATPPYDSTLSEWERYIELCGPIDLEISVPELIKERDLAPHQDYIHFSAPIDEEKAALQSFRTNADQVKTALLSDEPFIELLLEHPWVVDPEACIEAILSRPAYFSSLVIFLAAVGRVEVGKYARILGAKRARLPKLDLEWLETLLTGCLFYDPYIKAHEDIHRRIKKWLNRIGAIERRTVHLRSTDKLNRLLVTSSSKLHGISEIVQFEASKLGPALRLVILTDFIRLDDMPRTAEDEQPITRLGVVPIFEALRRKGLIDVKLGVLSGSIVLLPKSAVPALKARVGDAAAGLRIKPLKHDPAFVAIEMAESRRHQQLVSVMTDLFTAGEVHVLVGTTALLGEGWDAPSINTIILASYVGTFMLSNQMRGRAIRVETGNEEKAANIWHLVCVDPTQYEAGYDMETLTRRFKAFVGISNENDRIENGIDRLGLEAVPFSQEKMARMNRRMVQMAGNRAELKGRWDRAIEKGQKGWVVDELRAQPEGLPRSAVFTKTIRALIMQGILFGLFVFAEFMNSLRGNHYGQGAGSLKALVVILLFGFAISVILMLPKTLKGLWLWFRHGTIETSIKDLGHVVVQTLAHLEWIRTNPEDIEINAIQGFEGGVNFWIDGGTRQEHSLILEAVREVLDPIENPRYLLKRYSKWGWIKRVDVHAVPQVIGRNKNGAVFFHQQWRKRMGKVDLIFTRTPEGRKELLKARVSSLSGAFVKRAERLNSWH